MDQNPPSFQLFILAICLLLCSVLTLSIKNGHIYDDQNRQIFFHGFNIAVKMPPYLPKTDAFDQHMSFSKQDIQKLKQNGFNAIRLGIMWSGLQPTKDLFNDTYLEELEKIVNAAGDAGIYTLLEFHQKTLSASFCGIGLPPWLIHEDNRYKTFPFPVQRQKYPLTDEWIPDQVHCKRHNTSTYLYSYDCAQGFNQLYHEGSYLFQEITKAWQKIAQHFKGNNYVIAYDLLNEPWVGNQIRNPFLLIPGVAQKVKLQRFYDRLSQSIRSVDDATPICFEPTLVSMKIGATFDHVPGGTNYKNKSILCYSYGKWNEHSLGYKYADAIRLGVPALVSQMYSVMCPVDRAEIYGMGWFFFYYKDFGCNKSRELYQDDGEEIFKEEKLQLVANQEKSLNGICPVLIRTYLERVAGCYSYSQFDRKSGRFIGGYEAEPEGETILYMNKQHTYGNNYSIEAFPKEEVEIVESKDENLKNYVTLKFKGKQRTQVIINIIKL